jgi:hypothetical protein
MKVIRILTVTLILVLVGLLAYRFLRAKVETSEAPPGPPWFVDITDEAGINFVHDAGPTGTYSMPQAIGSGAAIFDCDGDGWLDILLLQKNKLFRQLPDGRFQDISAGSGLDFAGYNMGVAIGDVNNDGLPDVLITQYDGIRLFINQGQGKFLEQTKEAGLRNLGWGASAAFFDFDRDGWLDLVVVNYVDFDPSWPCTTASGQRDFCPPKTFRGQVTRLFRHTTVSKRDSIK